MEKTTRITPTATRHKAPPHWRIGSRSASQKRKEKHDHPQDFLHTLWYNTSQTMVRLPVCPLCNHEYADFPALSRVDNRTEICPACGRIEALYDYYARHARKPTLSGFADFLKLVQPIATQIEKAL